MRTSVGCWVRFAVASALTAAATNALAQDAPESKDASAPQELQEVTVTGSRIVRSDFKSDSPMVTVNADVLKNTGEVGIDQQLNKLPQFVPGANQVTSAGDIQSTPTNSPGIATVNLRGLGANRTLVLLDGRRTQPNNASLVIDLNTIPSTAIDSVEIITGGAGSAYGADAVAGVVNFKLKHNYEGVTLDAQSGETFRHDGAQTQASALIGSNFADDRGNAMVSLTYSKRDAIWNQDRPFERRAFTDPGTAAIDTFNNYPGFAGSSTQAAYDQVFGSLGYAPGTVKSGTSLYFVPGATTAAASVFSAAAGKGGIPAPGYTGALYPNYKILNNGNLGANSVNGFLSLPLTRFSAFSDAHLKINDNVTAYLQTNFDDNETVTQSGGWSPSVLQWGVTVPFDNNHPVPAALQTILSNRSGATATAPWALQNELDFMGPVNLDTTTKTYEILAGIRGNLGIKDWTYDLYASHGDTSQYVQYNNFVDLASYQALINLPNYGAGADFNNGRIGQLAHCTSGLNPFVNTPVSQDCKNIIAADASTTTDLKQNVAELDIQGAIVPLPAGDLRFAVGTDYRNNTYEYNPSKGLSTSNITSLTVGEFDTSSTHGRIGVTEGYAELLAPLLKDLPAVRSFNIDLGYRYSDYSTAGGVNTWKATGDWDVNGYIKFRGGRQVANRAPNVAELFQPPVFLTVPWTDHDPCSNVTRAPWGNVASNPNRKQVQQLCTALAGGFPIGDNYVGNQSLYFPLGRDLQQGNQNLKSENAQTWTAGTVLQSPFEDIKPLRHVTLSVDYYQVVIKGAIAPATTAITYQECFNVYGTNPSYDPKNPYCSLIIRSPINGFWIATNAQYQNLGEIKTSGVDSQLDWSMETAGPGMVFANINFNYLAAYDVQQVAGGPIFHYAGTIGSPITAPPYGAQFRWKLFTTLGYRIGPASVSMDWRHLPGAKNVAQVTSTGNGTLPVGSYDLFDLQGSWSITSHFDVRAGIENVADKQPPTVGIWPGVTNAAGVTDVAGSYDEIGRRFYVGFTARF
jgi:iron complex outermembrane recepter protein